MFEIAKIRIANSCHVVARIVPSEGPHPDGTKKTYRVEFALEAPRDQESASTAERTAQLTPEQAHVLLLMKK